MKREHRSKSCPKKRSPPNNHKEPEPYYKDNKMPTDRGRARPPEGLHQMIAGYFQSKSSVLMSNELCDFVQWAHQELRTEDIRSLLWTLPRPATPQLHWQMIQRELTQDTAGMLQLDAMARRSQPMPEGYKEPSFRWFLEFAKAVHILQADNLLMRDKIKALAEGSPVCYGGIRQLLRECNLEDLAWQLARATSNLDWFFKDRGDPEGEVSMRNILERIKAFHFTHCYLQEGKLIYNLNEASQRLQSLYFGGQ
ncbi:MAG: hypothetical protein Q9168_003619 [Polycauliona sp. 1 TL-2023]